MRQTKRKFVALSTALAMALVLVASLVPTTVAQALTGGPTYIINEVAFDFTSPNAGDSVSLGGEDGDEPSMTTAISTSTVGMKHSESGTSPSPRGYFVKDSINSVEDYLEVDDLKDALFVGTFESGKTYKAVVAGEADIDNGYALADDVNVTVNGGATIVDKYIENKVSGHSDVLILISFTVGGGDIPASVPVKAGYSDQTVAPGSAVTIGFDSPFSNFNNGTKQGKVYIDGNEVPGPYIEATEGSTIIKVAEEYMKQLSEGAHKMVVKFLDDTIGEATFTISSSAAASTAANGTSGTASSTAATTTKVTSPKTADVLPIAGIALVFVGATAIGVIAFRRKNS